MTKAISIDRRKPLAAEPRTGHNRWHPDIAPVVEVGEGEDVALETRDACDATSRPAPPRRTSRPFPSARSIR